MTNSSESVWGRMPPKRRERYFRIINDNTTNFHTIAQALHFLDDHFPPEKLDSALDWLIKHGTIGNEFVRWFENTCCKSHLEMHRLLLAIINNEHMGALIVGKNFRS